MTTWNQMVTWPMTSRDPERSRSWPHYTYGQISWKRLEIETNGPKIGNGPLGFEWSRDWWRHVAQKGQGHDQTPIYLGPIISTTVGDTDLVPMEYYRKLLPGIRMVTWTMTSRDPEWSRSWHYVTLKVKIGINSWLGFNGHTNNKKPSCR